MKTMTQAINELKPHLGDTVKTAEALEHLALEHLVGNEVENIGEIIRTVYNAIPISEQELFRDTAPGLEAVLMVSQGGPIFDEPVRKD